MKKFKVLFCLLLLVIGINIGLEVKAVDELPDNGGHVSSSAIIQNKTGTGPWDSDDNPGNDSSDDNDIVRSFDQVTWTIENTMALTGNEASSYTGGKLYFEATIPSVFESGQAGWDLSSMAWIENPNLSADKLTVSGYYSLPTENITIPGKQSVNFVLDIYGAPNGVKFTPTFKFWLNGNSEADYYVIEGNEITVSAAPKYNIRLVRNSSCESRTTLNIDGEDVTGRVFGYSVVYQLYNDNASKLLKGIEYPTGDITLDLDMIFQKKSSSGGNLIDITDQVTPILWNYQVAGLGANNAKIPGRNMYSNSSGFTINGNYTFPRGKAGDRHYSVLDSGNINIVQNGSVLNLTLSDYKFDGEFPKYNIGWSVNNPGSSYADNIGNFGSIYLQILVPDWDEYEGTTDYYLKVNDNNFNATSISGANTTMQMKSDDDATNVQYVKTKPGSYTSLVYLNGYTTGQIHTRWDTGDGRVQRGQVIRYTSNLQQNSNNDEDAHPKTINLLQKFDADCVELATGPHGEQYNTNNSDVNWKMWYVTKPDGSNWSSQQEMNDARVKDVVLYNNLNDIPSGYKCVGLYYESTDGSELKIWAYSLNSYVKIKDSAVIGQTYGFTQAVQYWTYQLDRSIYTAENPNVEWPADTVYDPIRNYVKTEYDSTGAQIVGTHAGGTYYGNTVQVVGAQQKLSIKAIVKGTDTSKINYDISKNEYDVTYKMEPVISSSYAAQTIDGISVELVATLPAGVTYNPGTSSLGEPEIINNVNGTTSLKWNIQGCAVNQPIEPVLFDAHISEDTPNGTQYEVSALMLADTEKVGNTKIEDRTATTTIQIINLSSHRLYKSVTTPVIEKNGQIHYSIAYKNNTDENIPDFQLLDILPYNGDSRGTDYSGTYKLAKLVVTQKDGNGSVISNGNLDIRYTEDEGVRTTVTSKDSNLANDWTQVTSENIQKAATAYAIKGQIGGQGSLVVDIYLDTLDNMGLDKYVNNASAQIYSTTEELVTGSVTSQVVKRTIEGIAWDDANANGIKDADEQVFKNVEMTLVDNMGRQVRDVDGNTLGSVKTNDSGYYKFTNLPRGNYYVRVVEPNAKYILTEKEVGNNSAVNSKFKVDEKETDIITKLDSIDLPELTVSNENAGFVKKPTKVIVNYLEEGTLTKLSDEITINGRIDDNYTTVNKLDEINAANGNKYEYTRIDGNAAGTMTANTIYVTYYYQKKPAEIEVLYKEIGTEKELANKETSTARVDDTYTTTNKLNEINAANGNKYEFVRVDGNATGTYTVEKQTITYWYQKKMSEIEVNYLELGTNTVLSEQVKKQDRIDNPYTTENKLDEINANHGNKYEFVRVDGNANGNYTVNKQVITYYYQKKNAKVVVLHVLEGTDVSNPASVTDVLYPTQNVTGRVDDTYTTQNKLAEINRGSTLEYEYVGSTNNTSGTMTVDTIYVIYTYKTISAKVIVNHLEKDTDVVLNPQEVKNGFVGNDYETSNKLNEINQANGNKYELVTPEPSNKNGKYTREDIVVNYYYQKKMARIEVNYLEVGTNNALSTQEVKQDRIDAPYTTENRLNEINQRYNNQYDFVRVDGNANGNYTLDTQVITYWYQKKAAEIEVQYREVGTEEELAEKVKKTSRVGDAYTTEDKLDEINANHGNKYEFVRIDGNEEGIYQLEKQVIIYYYQKKLADLEVNYLELGTNKVLSEQILGQERIDTPYTTENKLDQINRVWENKYEFVRVDGNATGNYTLDKQVITYYYQKKMAEIEVNYLEVGTNAVLSTQITKQDRIDNPYSTENKLDEINENYEDKYEFVKVDGNANGTYTADKQVITYWYQKKPAEIEVLYKEIGTEKELATKVEKTAKVDDEYTTENKLNEINASNQDKYEFVRVDGNETGTYTLEKQTITYWYQKKMAEVEVNYLEVDTDKVLSDQVNMSDRIDNPYTTENKLDEINAEYGNKYEFVRVEGNPEGNYTLQKQVITYYYQKKMAEIEVNYLEVGTNAVLSEQIKKQDRIDNPYITENKLDSINENYENKYEFVRVEGNPEGNYTLDKQVITYYYQKKMAEVEVNYLEVGTNAVLSEQVNMTDRIDNPYTTENKLEEINAANENKYEFVRVDGNENGTYTLEKQVITYWYQKKMAEVEVNYLEVGTNVVLSEQVNMTDRIDNPYITENKLNEINEANGNKYEFVKVDGNPEGSYTLDKQVITYWYQKKSAEIEVQYREVGTEEELADKVEKSARVDDTYTTENKLDEINAENGNKYEFVRVEGNPEGTYTLEKQTIIYYYQKKMAEVEVNYLEVGTNVVLSEQVNMTDRIDNPYITENKLNEINAANGNKYEFVKVDGNTEGNYTLDKQVITYWYQKKETKVVIIHVEQGTDTTDPSTITSVLYPTETINGRIDDEYSTVDRVNEINRNSQVQYEVVSKTDNWMGNMTLDTQYVIYVYRKIPAHIVVKHVDINTKEELLDSETRNGYVGNEYTTENKLTEVNNKHENKYELVTPEPTNKDGIYSSQEQVIIYYYDKKPAQVNVKYVDVDTEEELADGEEIVGKVDDEYTTEDKVKEINESSKYKYVLVKTTENTEGLMTVEDIEVVYYYKKVEAQVIVKYVDEKTGEEIAQREYIGGYVGDEYTSKSKEIDEYTLNEKKLPNNAEGEMTEETIEVIYYYNKMIKIPETADMNVSMMFIIMIASIGGITLVRKYRRQ